MILIERAIDGLPAAGLDPGLAASAFFVLAFGLLVLMIFRLTDPPAGAVIFGNRRVMALSTMGARATRAQRILLVIGATLGLLLIREGMGGAATLDAALESPDVREGAMLLFWCLATGWLTQATGMLLTRHRPVPASRRLWIVIAQICVLLFSLVTLTGIFLIS